MAVIATKMRDGRIGGHLGSFNIAIVRKTAGALPDPTTPHRIVRIIESSATGRRRSATDRMMAKTAPLMAPQIVQIRRVYSTMRRRCAVKWKSGGAAVQAL